MEQSKIKDKVIYFVAILSMCIGLISMAYFLFLRTVQIDLENYIVLNYMGENGLATLEVGVRSEDINQRIQEFLDTVEFSVTPNQNLSNGDVVTIDATYDEELAQTYHYEIINTSMECIVEGLNDRYASLQEMDSKYLKAILDSSEEYIDQNLDSIIQYNEAVEDWQDYEYVGKELVYRAFLKSKAPGTSDRMIQIYRFDYAKEDKTIRLYYLVCVPDINDGQEIHAQDIFSERVYLSVQEIEQSNYNDYVHRVYGDSFSIQEIPIDKNVTQ